MDPAAEDSPCDEAPNDLAVVEMDEADPSEDSPIGPPPSLAPLFGGIAASIALAAAAAVALIYARSIGLKSPLFHFGDPLLPVVGWGLTAYLFTVGAVVGSFLNVVAYRLPRGASLLNPPSSCPRCGRRILVRDNVPVLGWLLLRGRCRGCRGAISARYPAVELTTGAAFAALATTDLFSGATAPAWESATSPSYPSLEWRGVLAAVYALHAWLTCVLVADAAMRFDRVATPRRLAWATIAVAACLAAAAPTARPMHWTDALESQASPAVRALAAVAVSAAAGWLLGVALSYAAPRYGRRRPSYATATAAIGASLGAASVVAIAAAAALVLAAFRWRRVRRRLRRLAAAIVPPAVALLWMLWQGMLLDAASDAIAYVRSTLQ